MARFVRFEKKVFGVSFWSFLLGISVGVTLCVVSLCGLVVLGALLVFYMPERFIPPPPAAKTPPGEVSYPPPPLPAVRRADYNWKLRALDGRELDLAELRGKVIFLNLWATWCPPCVNEMPSIQRLYEQTKDERIVFVCASAEASDTVRRFVQERGYTLPVYTFEGEPPAVFRTEAVPTTSIVAPDGTIRFQHTGAAKWDDRTCIEYLNKLAAESDRER